MDDMPVNPPEQPAGTPPGMPPETPPGWTAPNWAPPVDGTMLAAPALAAPAPPPAAAPRRRLLKVAIGVGAAAGVAVGAGALANAATSTTDSPTTAATDPGSSTTVTTPGSTTTSPGTAAPAAPVVPGGPGGPGGFGAGPRGFGGIGGAMFGGGAVVHGEFTIMGPNGYETIDERTGTVSDVTDTSGSTWSLTVKSADGTSGTFTVDSGTSVNGGEMGIGSVKQGDTVRVEAVASGGTSTAKSVLDETMLKANAGTWRSVGPAGPTGPTGSSASTSGLAPPV